MAVVPPQIVDLLKLLLKAKKRPTGRIWYQLKLPVGDIDPVIGRDDEIIVSSISIAEPRIILFLSVNLGVGKLPFRGLVQKIVDGDVPHKLKATGHPS